LLAASGYPMVTLDSQVAFNEVKFGFVPHSGATYYLANTMPGDFGTFMALTGLPIHGSDACRMKLTEGVVQDPKYYAEEVADVLHS
jgi:enoyl-CoA hydratase/carnithine racemase